MGGVCTENSDIVYIRGGYLELLKLEVIGQFLRMQKSPKMKRIKTGRYIKKK